MLEYFKICFPAKAIIAREQSKYTMSFDSNNRENPGLPISSCFKFGIVWKYNQPNEPKWT